MAAAIANKVTVPMTTPESEKAHGNGGMEEPAIARSNGAVVEPILRSLETRLPAGASKAWYGPLLLSFAMLSLPDTSGCPGALVLCTAVLMSTYYEHLTPWDNFKM